MKEHYKKMCRNTAMMGYSGEVALVKRVIETSGSKCGRMQEANACMVKIACRRWFYT